MTEDLRLQMINIPYKTFYGDNLNINANNGNSTPFTA